MLILHRDGNLVHRQDTILFKKALRLHNCALKEICLVGEWILTGRRLETIRIGAFSSELNLAY